MTVTERVAYVRGLFEGFEVNVDKKEGRLFKEIIDLLEDMALSITDLEEENEALQEVIDAMIEDIYDDDDSYDEEDVEPDDMAWTVSCSRLSARAAAMKFMAMRLHAAVEALRARPAARNWNSICPRWMGIFRWMISRRAIFRRTISRQMISRRLNSIPTKSRMQRTTSTRMTTRMMTDRSQV